MTGNLIPGGKGLGRAASQEKFEAFTRYVQQPNATTFAPMWQKLRNVFIGELRRRSLWSSPPRYLGLLGSKNWQSHGSDDPVDEILVDCYISIFLERHARLQAQVEIGKEIDGLVFKCVRDFVHERQAKFDPLGRRVFQVAERAVRAALAEGDLMAVSLDDKTEEGRGDRIGNNRILVITKSLLPPTAPSTGPIDDDVFSSIVSGWSDELLPNLITGVGPQAQKVVTQLQRQILGLGEQGIPAFRFGDLVKAMKNDVRRRWTASYNTEKDESGDEIVVLSELRPALSMEDAESYHELVDFVSGRIDERRHEPKRQRQLRSLFNYLRLWAADPEAPQQPPSNRWLAKELDISRGTLPVLFSILRKMIRECLSVSMKAGPTNRRLHG